MQNVHERFGMLEFTKRMKDTTTRGYGSAAIRTFVYFSSATDRLRSLKTLPELLTTSGLFFTDAMFSLGVQLRQTEPLCH